jgi:hypothetical protein
MIRQKYKNGTKDLKSGKSSNVLAFNSVVIATNQVP